MTKAFTLIFLEPGYKVLAVHRRLYEGDRPRFFTGVVDAFEGGLLKVTGHSWMPAKGGLTRKAEARTKILSLASGTLLVYQLPMHTELAQLKVQKSGGQLWLTDGKLFKLDLSESE